MFPLIICSILLCTIRTCFADTCPLISLCPDYVQYAERADDEKLNNRYIPSDQEIGQFGNFSGLKPRLYDLRLRFSNLTHYTGSVKISAFVVQTTNTVTVNLRDDLVKFEESRVSIRPDCSRPPKEGTCIQDMFNGRVGSVLVIELNNPLPVLSDVEIQFGYFWSSAGSQSDKDFSRGLLTMENSTFGATYTYFQMRKARSVFPCFDHMAMKAQFQLTLTHPKELDVYSTAAPDTSLPVEQNNFAETKFPTTPVIPISSLCFALTKGYVTAYPSATHSELSVTVPEQLRRMSTWDLPDTEAMISFAVRVTNLDSHSMTFQFLIVYSMPVEIVDSLGLIIIDGDRLRNIDDEYRGLIFQSIVHQWLGNVVAAENWNYICLIEGLGVYLEWMYMEAAHNMKIAQRVEQLMTVARSFVSGPTMDEDYESDSEMESACSALPVLFYHNLAAVLGNQVIVKLTQDIVAKSNFSSPSLETWDSVIATATESSGGLSAYASTWFKSAVPIILNINIDSNKLFISQFLPDGQNSNVYLLYDVYTSSDKNIITVSENSQQLGLDLGPNTSFCLVDPDRVTMTRKIYQTSYYLRIFTGNFSDPFGHFTEKRLENFVEDFCESLMADTLHQYSGYDKNEWLAVFSAVADRHTPSCLCCLKPPGSLPNKCADSILDCGSIILLSEMGFNFPKMSDDEWDDE